MISGSYYLSGSMIRCIICHWLSPNEADQSGLSDGRVSKYILIDIAQNWGHPSRHNEPILLRYSNSKSLAQLSIIRQRTERHTEPSFGEVVGLNTTPLVGWHFTQKSEHFTIFLQKGAPFFFFFFQTIYYLLLVRENNTPSYRYYRPTVRTGNTLLTIHCQGHRMMLSLPSLSLRGFLCTLQNITILVYTIITSLYHFTIVLSRQSWHDDDREYSQSTCRRVKHKLSTINTTLTANCVYHCCEEDAEPGAATMIGMLRRRSCDPEMVCTSPDHADFSSIYIHPCALHNHSGAVHGT